MSHQGSYGDNSAAHLEFIADYLSCKLGVSVKYCAESMDEYTTSPSKKMQNGEITLFGNTRLYQGEEINDVRLAKQFAGLGDFIAIGGFSKAHRTHASNVGILDFKKGFATNSLIFELERLKPWSGMNESMR